MLFPFWNWKLLQSKDFKPIRALLDLEASPGWTLSFAHCFAEESPGGHQSHGSQITGFKDTPTHNSEKRSMHRWSGVYWSWMPMWMLLDPTAWVQLSLHVLEATHQSLQHCQRLVLLKDSFEKAVWKKVWNCQVWDRRLWSCPARALQSWGLAQCKRSERHQAWNASLYASHGQSFEEVSVIFPQKRKDTLRFVGLSLSEGCWTWRSKRVIWSWWSSWWPSVRSWPRATAWAGESRWFLILVAKL